MSSSPLLHGQKTQSPLDLITERLYFIWPLSRRQIEFLNRPILPSLQRYPFWINYWSLTHVGWGIIWALLQHWTGWSSIFNLTGLVIFHSVFELWELWAGGYLTGIRRLTFEEMVDVFMDTVFAVVGYLLFSFFIKKISI